MFSRPQLQPRAKRAKSPCADSVTDGFLNGIAAQVSKKKSKKIKRAPFKSNTKLGSTSNHTPSPCHPFLRAIAAMCSMCARQREYISRKQNACWNTWLADWLTGNEEGQIMRTHTHTHSHADRVDNVHQRLDQGGRWCRLGATESLCALHDAARGAQETSQRKGRGRGTGVRGVCQKVFFPTRCHNADIRYTFGTSIWCPRWPCVCLLQWLGKGEGSTEGQEGPMSEGV